MISFMAIRYDEDIQEAALFHPDLDEKNAEKIGSFHNEDPRVVLIDIREEREVRESRRHWR